MLNNRQRRILHFLYKNENYPLPSLYQKFHISHDYDGGYNFLIEEKYIDLNFGEAWTKHTVYLTPDGKAYLDEQWKNNFRFWFPVTLSIIAIIIAVLDYFK